MKKLANMHGIGRLIASVWILVLIFAVYGCAAPAKGPVGRSSQTAAVKASSSVAAQPQSKAEAEPQARSVSPAAAGGMLVYGYIDMHEVSTMVSEVTVQNASSGKTYKCVAADNVFWAGGLAGGTYRLVSFESAKGTVYRASEFIKSDTEVSGRQGELLFMGSYKFRKTGKASADFDLVRRSFPGEKEALEALLKHNKGEWWEKVIRTRLASM